MTKKKRQRLYPDLEEQSPLAEEGHFYRLQKIGEIEKFLQDEVADRDALSKRCKRRAAVLTAGDTSLVMAITSLEIGSIATLATGVGIPLSIALASAGLFLGLASAITHKTLKLLDSKAKKHEKIKTLAESKLDSISGLVSKAAEDSAIDDDEYRLILGELQNYRTLKEQIRMKNRQVQGVISAEQREAILAQGREEGKQDFLAKIAQSSAIPNAPVM